MHFAKNPEILAKSWCTMSPSFVETFQVACKLFYLFRFILVLVHHVPHSVAFLFVLFYFGLGATQCGSLLLLRFFCGNFPSGPDSPWAAQFTPKWLSWVTEQSCMMITIPMSTMLHLHTEYSTTSSNDEVSLKSIQLLENAIPGRNSRWRYLRQKGNFWPSHFFFHF